jgi:hydrogenase small subunit
MDINRREFLKYCISSAAVLGLDATVVGKLSNALAQGAPLPGVIWLAGAACTGCTVSLANRISATAPVDIADLLLNYISLDYHPNLSGAAGEQAIENALRSSRGDFILAVEGGTPTAFDGHTCVVFSKGDQEITMLRAVRYLAPRALACLSIGTCASFGGICGSSPNPTGVQTLQAATGVPTINIPGCPTHPDWVVWTIAQLLAGTVPALDSYRRPAALFSGSTMNVHQRCPRRGTDEAETFGVEGRCLRELGCKGPRTQADCPIRKWNNATNWCVGANSMCLGCTESGFPDAFSPFYSGEDD